MLARHLSLPGVFSMNSPFKVCSCAASFGVFCREPIDRLEAAGCDVTINPFGRALTKKETIEFAADADAVVLGNGLMPASVIESLPKLKMIARHGRGVDGIDFTAATSRGITITNTPGANTEETADLTFGMILDLERHITLMNNELKNGVWKKRAGHSLYGKTIGIIGVGDIGIAVARRAMGFGMDILGCDINQRCDAAVTGLIFTSLNDLLRRSDIVTIHTPLTDMTKNLIGAKELRMMKDDAILVNTARAGIVRQAALEKALMEGRLYGYATDVHEKVPPRLSRIADYPNVIVTPHAGSATLEANLRMSMAVADNIIAVKNGVVPPNLVTPMNLLYG